MKNLFFNTLVLFIFTCGSLAVVNGETRGVAGLMMRISRYGWTKVNIASSDTPELNHFEMELTETENSGFFETKLSAGFVENEENLKFDLPASESLDMKHGYVDSNTKAKFTSSIKLGYFLSTQTDSWNEVFLDTLAYDCRCRKGVQNLVCVDEEALLISGDTKVQDSDLFVEHCKHIPFTAIVSKRNSKKAHAEIIAPFVNLLTQQFSSLEIHGGIVDIALMTYLEKMQTIRRLEFISCEMDQKVGMYLANIVSSLDVRYFKMIDVQNLNRVVPTLLTNVLKCNLINFVSLQQMGLKDNDLKVLSNSPLITINFDKNYLSREFFKGLSSDIHFEEPKQFDEDGQLREYNISHKMYLVAEPIYDKKIESFDKSYIYLVVALSENRKLKIEVSMPEDSIVGFNRISFQDYKNEFKFSFKAITEEDKTEEFVVSLQKADRLSFNSKMKLGKFPMQIQATIVENQ